MTEQQVFITVFGVAALAYIIVRQLMWQRVDLGKLLRTPLLLVVLAGFVAWQTWTPAMLDQIGPLDLLMIIVELAAAVAGGVAIGRLAQIRRTVETVSIRFRWSGLAVWLGLLILRIGFELTAHLIGAHRAASAVTVVLMIALVKGVQAVTLHRRLARPAPVPPQAPAAGKSGSKSLISQP